MLDKLTDASEAVEDAVALERMFVDGVEVARDEDSEAVGVDTVSKELKEMVHDSKSVEEADSVSVALVSEALVSMALEGTLLLSEDETVKEPVVDPTLETLLADKVSSEELNVSDAGEDLEAVPVIVADDSASEDVAVAELTENENERVLLQT